MTVGEQPADLSPERAAPEEMSRRLMESEHRGRYMWASQFARGREILDAGCGTGYGSEILAEAGARRVVGLDISDDAIDSARASSTQSTTEFLLGDLHELPFNDATFDVAVCFEAIEHVRDQARVIAELRRVLHPSGVLVISSPNRGVYPGGNPHHTHEFTADELEQALAQDFANVKLYRQSPWLAAAVLDDDEVRAVGSQHELRPRVIKIEALEPGKEVFTLAVASDTELPVPDALILMGDAFEVRWWQEQVRIAHSQGREETLAEMVLIRKEAAVLRQQADAYRENSVNSARKLLDIEEHLARVIARGFLLEDELELRAENLQAMTEKFQRSERVMEAMKASLSWKLTAPLRAIKRRS